MRRDVLIIGGGPAGAAAAARLAGAGRSVVVLEREGRAHDKVCGEFLSAAAVGRLDRLGIDPMALGAAPLDRLAVCIGARRMETPLPFRALSLSRRILDEALLARAAEAGAEVRRPARIVRLEGGPGAWRALAADSQAYEADAAMLATGKHDLRGFPRPAEGQRDLVGFKLHLPAERLERTVELHLFEGGYAGLEPVEGGRANLCLVVRKAALGATGGWAGLAAHLKRACPQLAPWLADAEGLRPLAVSGMPYGHVRARAAEGLWRLGDQAAVIPSFAGEGLSIALASAEFAARTLIAGGGPDAYQQAFARRVGKRVKGATMLSRLLVSGPGGAVAAGLAGAPEIAGVLARSIARVTRTSDTGVRTRSSPP